MIQSLVNQASLLSGIVKKHHDLKWHSATNKKNKSYCVPRVESFAVPMGSGSGQNILKVCMYVVFHNEQDKHIHALTV